MKIAAPYVENSRWRDIPDEYNLSWSKNSNEKKLLNFCEIIPNKRINIYTQKDVDFNLEAIKKAKEKNPNIYVRLNISQTDLIEDLINNKIDFYFDTSHPCYNYTILSTLMSMGVSDVYISDDLFYNLKEVKAFLTEKNIQIRIILNRIPSTSPGKGYDLCGTYISPRDMPFLKDLIDVAEFDCGKIFYDWNKFNVLYQAFFEKEEWFGDLRNLNSDLKFYYPVYSTIPNSILWRIRCRRKCALGDSCNHCEKIINIARSLYQEGMTVKLKNEVKKE